jgi:xanthine dehydrogenase YagR molybdenum-binding subunit
VSTAASDIGTGTWTILAQIGADVMGLALESVTPKIGDFASDLPGRRWLLDRGVNGSAVMAACEALKATLFKHAKTMTNSPLAQAELGDVVFVDGRIALKDDLARSLSFKEVMQAAELSEIVEKGKAAPNVLQMRKYISTHIPLFSPRYGSTRIWAWCAFPR